MIADRLDHGESIPELENLSAVSTLSQWPACKARRYWPPCCAERMVSREQAVGQFSRVLARPGWPDYIFAFHDHEGIGPRMLARIAEKDGPRTEGIVAVG